MSVWFTSDIHHNHVKVAKIRAAEAMVGLENPFDDQCVTNWHNNTLAFWWDYLVKPSDQIWVLGDISAGGKQAQLDALEWIKDRPGQKHLIPGNHDGCHPMYRDSHKWQRIYLEAFESVQLAARRKISLGPSLSQEVLLSHYPYEGDHTSGDRHSQWRLRDEGIALLHGHVHSPVKLTRSSYRHPAKFEGYDDLYAPAKQIHVGVDAWDYKPVHLDQIVELIR